MWDLAVLLWYYYAYHGIALELVGEVGPDRSSIRQRDRSRGNAHDDIASVRFLGFLGMARKRPCGSRYNKE
jgi:hypothetical protein